MFSIADIQTAEEPEFAQEEEDSSDASENIHSYPIRVSISVTKVWFPFYITMSMG